MTPVRLTELRLESNCSFILPLSIERNVFRISWGETMGEESLYSHENLYRFACIFQWGNATPPEFPERCLHCLLRGYWTLCKCLISPLPSEKEICDKAWKCLPQYRTQIKEGAWLEDCKQPNIAICVWLRNHGKKFKARILSVFWLHSQK